MIPGSNMAYRQPKAETRTAIIAYLKEVEARYPGLDHVMIAWALGTPRALMIEQLTRFAEEVMPAFISSRRTPASSD